MIEYELNSIPDVPIMPLNLPVLQAHHVQVSVLCLDQIDAHASGNKYFKVLAHLDWIEQNKCRHVISFGGAYSNHVHALSVACDELNRCRAEHERVQLTIIVPQGQYEHTGVRPSATLLDAHRLGAVIRYVSRSEYRQRHSTDYLKQLSDDFEQAHVIAEGAMDALGYQGSHVLGAYVAKLMARWSDKQQAAIDWLMLPCGTTSTLMGMLHTLPSALSVLGVPVLKPSHYKDQLAQGCDALPLKALPSWSIDETPHVTRYGQVNDQLRALAAESLQQCGIPLDPIYNVKVVQRLIDKVVYDGFAHRQHVLLMNTGGLQGARGFDDWPVSISHY
ncbi:MAG: hypothetical protein AAGF06_06295 [Pseudomonadota bacterium]